MAYRIRYHTKQKRGFRSIKAGWILFYCCFLAIFVMIASCLAPTELEQIRQLFFPQQYLDDFLQCVQEGETISGVVDAFWQEIVNGS